MQVVTADRLIELSARNARLLRVNAELDGAAADFGVRFWTVLEGADPLGIAALRQAGVSKVLYRDRYLLTPLTFRLLYEVLKCLPGKSANTRIEISTAQQDRLEPSGFMVYHSFPTDHERKAALGSLFPQATIVVQPKSVQQHARNFQLQLGDGRSLQILLDQGLGAWKAEGQARHDFSTQAAKQADQIREARIQVRMSTILGSPIILSFVKVST